MAEHGEHGHGEHGRPGHGHGGHRHHGFGSLGVAFLLNSIFTLIEVGGGIWTNSIAILADALHDAGDSLSLGLAWALDRYSRRGRTAVFTYGYRRFSVLGALITGIVLLAGLGFVAWHAIERLLDPQEVRAGGMIALAVLGVLFNGAAVLRLKGGTSLTEKVASWHLLEDTFGWIAVLIGSAAIAIWNVPIIDPILSLGIAVVILWNVFRNLRKVAAVFLQSAPESFDVDEFESNARQIEGVRSLHHIHSWSIDGESHVFTAHVVLDPDLAAAVYPDTKAKLRALLAPHHFEHITIELEQDGEPCGSG